jgi:iron(III) transport system permease protein
MTRSAPAVLRSAPGPGGWLLGSSGIALVVLAPIATLAMLAARGSADLWRHLLAHVLPGALLETAILLTGVGVTTGILGTGAAWLVTAYDFRGRRLLDWALLLPLAVPTYIVAYTYLDILHPVGPVQTALRAVAGIDSPRDFRLPDIRSMWGCILLLGVVLYPYVYLTTRAMFLMQAANLIDVARTLGAGRAAVFFRVALPLARPAVAIGLSLVLMEALNDIGASEFLGVRTLTVSIYTTWVTRSDLPGAAQIALAMLAVVVGLVMFERWARRRRRYANDAQSPRPLTQRRLTGLGAVAAFAVGAIPVGLGFVVPAAYLLEQTIARVRFAGVAPVIVSGTINTLWISLAATVLTLAGGIVVVYAARVQRGLWPGLFAQIASLGYAVPGTVLAIGILPVVTGLDSLLDAIAASVGHASTGLLLLGSGTALVYAYAVRFLAVAAGGVEAGFSRVSTSIDDAARTLGETASRSLRRIHLPMTRPALATAALLVFVDCMKELPATLLLRPIGFETLATHLYGEAARGTYEDGAIAALLIVAAGLIPVLILARVGRLDAVSTAQPSDRRASDLPTTRV